MLGGTASLSKDLNSVSHLGTEDFAMSTIRNRARFAATVAAIALTAVNLTTTSASAARRHHRHWGGEAAAFGFFAAALGTAAAIAASNEGSYNYYAAPYGPYAYGYHGAPYAFGNAPGFDGWRGAWHSGWHFW
jgi:hypothetical protein